MKLFLVFYLLIGFSSQAADVAFVEIRTPDGKLVQLEKDGRYAHIAISYKGQWLHAHPYRGVEIISKEKLEKMGTLTIIHLPNTPEFDEYAIKDFIGKPYDSKFTWDNDSIYCSELVAKLLNIEPSEMKFNSEVWSEKMKKNKDQLGISPDDIYKILKDSESLHQPAKHPTPSPSCHRLMKSFLPM